MRDVRRLAKPRAVRGCRPRSRARRLAGQRVHHIEIEGVESRLAASSTAAIAWARSCTRPRAFRCCVVEALHTDRQARHARLPERFKSVFLEGAGVGLERDLGIGVEPHQGAHIAEQSVDGLGRKQARACRHR